MEFDTAKFKPRNTLVLCQLQLKKEEQHGVIIVSTNTDEQCEAIVLAIGPDCLTAADGQAGTHDLKKGQRVFVQHQSIIRQGSQRVGMKQHGIPLKERGEGSDKLMLFEQANILAILAEEGDELAPSLAETNEVQDTPSQIIT